jgi:hypothetical protein
MPNLEIAEAIINECNVKFCDGTGNLKNHPWDQDGIVSRSQQLSAYRQQLNAAVPVQLTPHYTAQQRSLLTGQQLDNMPQAKVGNCGERSYWVYYKLTQRNVPNVVILSGNPATSINHDFVVIGATNVQSGYFSQSVAPAWAGHDIVICEPWHQAGVLYDFGVAYPLASWTKWIPKIISITLEGRQQKDTLDRNHFFLNRFA